jgi:hypothetical protein
MAKDAAVSGTGIIGRAFAALGISIVVLAMIFAMRLGFRPDIVTREALFAIAGKLMFTISLSIAALCLLLQEAVPGQRSGRLWLLLLVPFAILCLESAFEFWSYGLDGWQDRLVGRNGWRCLVVIPALAIVPLIGLFSVLHAGAPTRPMVAGGLAGVAAMGLAATFYALNCPDDSPLFVTVWYGLALSIVAFVGTAAARAFSKW